MEFVHRFRDSIAGYLSPPNKRRRTTGPSTPDEDEEPMFDATTSEPQGSKTQALVITKVSKTIIRNSRKRAYVDDEEDTVVTLKPEDSVSQIGVAEGSEEEEEDEEDEEGQEASGSDVGDEEDEEGEEESGSEIGDEEEEELEVEEGDSDVDVGDEDDEGGELADVDEDSEDIGDGGEEDPDAVQYSEEEVELGSDDDELVADEDGSVEEGSVDEGSIEEGSVEEGSVEEGSVEEGSVEEGNEDDDNSDSGVIDMMEEEEEEEEDEVDISAKEAAAAEARVQEYLARQAELALRKEDIEKAKAAGDWHPDALILFERLSLRSFEEVLPAEFKIDFPTLPEDIFAPYKVETFVHNNCYSPMSCIRALKGLLGIGMRARETLARNGYPEKFIAKEIKKHIKWSEKDGGYERLRYLPVIVVVAAKPNQATEVLSAAIEAQMKFLAERHREYLALPEERINEVGETEKYKRQPPLLYGMIVARTMVIFVTMDSADPESRVKHLTHFDFNDKPMDVWNGFAIAYMCIMAKKYIMAYKDEFDEEPEETDPDL